MEFFHNLNSFTVWIIQSTGYVGIALAMALESFMIPIPSEIILPFGGYLAAEGDLNIFGVILSGAIGGTIGSIALYYLSFSFGSAFVKKYGKYFFVSQEHVKMTNEWFKKYGNFTVFTTRLLPIVRGIISIPAGIARMNMASFAIYTFLGTLIWSLILTYFGFQLGISNLGTHLIWSATIGIASVIMFIYLISRFAKKYVKIFNTITILSLWFTLAFFVSYALYESFSPINKTDLNYTNLLKIQKIVEKEQAFAFCVVGNTFRNLKIPKVCSQYGKFILALGNMIYAGDRAKYRLFVYNIKKLKTPIILAAGKRELDDQGYQNYYSIFGNYDYAGRIGNSYFIIINDANRTLSAQQINWISNELAYASEYRYRIVAMNIPPSWVRTKGETLNRKISRILKEIFKTRNVSLVLSTGSPATASLKNIIPYALVNAQNYLKVEIKSSHILMKFGRIKTNRNAFMDMISMYLYSFMVLEWPSIGIVIVIGIMAWIFWRRYSVEITLKKRR